MRHKKKRKEGILDLNRTECIDLLFKSVMVRQCGIFTGLRFLGKEKYEWRFAALKNL